MSILASDNFNRADGTLASPWAVVQAGRNFLISSNAIVAEFLSQDTCWHYDGGVTWPDDQYSAAKISVTGSGGVGYGVATRAPTSGTTTHYRCVVDQGASNNIEFGKKVAGTFTLLANRTTAWTNGDVLKVVSSGSTHQIFQNGVQLGADISDSAIASGKPGMTYSSTATGGGIDDWEGGDLGGGSKSIPIMVRFPPAMLAR